MPSVSFGKTRIPWDRMRTLDSAEQQMVRDAELMRSQERLMKWPLRLGFVAMAISGVMFVLIGLSIIMYGEQDNVFYGAYTGGFGLLLTACYGMLFIHMRFRMQAARLIRKLIHEESSAASPPPASASARASRPCLNVSEEE